MKRSLIVVVALIGCGPADRHNGGGPDASGGSDGNNNTGDDSGGGDGCSDAAKLIYVIDTNKVMSQFNPVTKTFTDLGTLNCPAGPFAQPFSMGVDRDATAWVLYNPQAGPASLYRVETKNNLHCTKAAWQPGNMGHARFGMGFSTNEAGGTTDTLFIAGGMGPPAPTSKLARLDMTSFAPTNIATIQGYPELTGTGSAELWGFFPSDAETHVSKLDKTTGSEVKTYPLTGLTGAPAAWAFAFHSGDFWIFLMKDGESSTTVHQMNGMTGAITGTTPTSGRRIVGAGVSTCAPVIF